MRKRGLGLLLLIAISFQGLSQFSDSVHHYVSFAGTGNLNKTSIGTTYLFNNSLKFDINKKNVAINSFANYVYGENPTNKTNNDFISAVNVDMFKSLHKLYYWGLATYEKSYSLKVNNRFQVGVGLGYSLLTKPGASLVLSDGLLYETSSLSKADQRGRTSYETVRNSFRIKFKFLISDIIKIDGYDFLQNSLSDGDDYIIKSHTSVSIKIYKWLNLAMVVDYNRQNITATDNLLVTYGLMFDRYF